MRSIVGLWRWRGNPLCRASDRREAWLALWAVALILVGAPLVGWFGAAKTHDALLDVARREQHSRHRAWATAESVESREPTDSDPESAADSQGHRRVVARWAGPDGSSHKATLRTGRRVQPGDRFRVWTDARGRVARPPMTRHTASSHAALAGLAAGAAAAGAVEGARRLAVRQVMRRRYARWEAEWERIGPDWGRAGRTP